jgi:hypothetical protein
MTKIDAIRQWAGTLFAFFALLLNYNNPNAGAQVALALPMCFFFVSLAAFYTRKRMSELELQIKELRKTIDGTSAGHS